MAMFVTRRSLAEGQRCIKPLFSNLSTTYVILLLANNIFFQYIELADLLYYKEAPKLKIRSDLIHILSYLFYNI